MKASVKKGLGTTIWLLSMIIILGGALAFVLNPSPAKSIFGYRMYEVLSGSMTPALRTGELALVQITPPQDIAVGDIVTYAVSPDGTTVVTHRVVDKTTDSEGQTVFSTKGDAADTVDTNVPAAAVIGVVRGHIPIIGYIIGFVRANFIASLMLIIAAILVVLAVKNLSAGKKKKPANPS